MISKRDSKFIQSLQLKKFRQLHRQFVVEGAKNVIELLQSDFEITTIYATDSFRQKFAKVLLPFTHLMVSANASELQAAGSLTTNAAALAVVHLPKERMAPTQPGLTLAFEKIQDPSNLGSALRVADWYGLNQIVCSPDAVDAYNPKVIAASMGSFVRVQVHYADLATRLSQTPRVYGATLQGTPIHEVQFETPAVILFGNESAGISERLKPYLHQAVTIPRYGHAESLNLAVATALFCDYFKRKTPTA